MVYKSFILLVIGVCILEVNSWPRREFQGFGGFAFGDTPDTEQKDDNKDDRVEDSNSEGQRGRFHHRHREGFGLPLVNPGPIAHALRENFQRLPSLPARVFLGKDGLLQNFLSSGSTSTSTSTSSSTSTSTSTITTTSKPKEESKATENPEKSPSSEQSLETLPAQFTFMLPTEKPKKSDEDKKEKPGKSSTPSAKNPDEKNPPPGMNRRLINAPDRCQEDGAGRCREAFD